MQVPQSRRKGHVDRLRVEEKWQSRARITETSFGLLDAQENATSPQPLFDKDFQRKASEKVEDWHFERPQVCTNLTLQFSVDNV